MEDPSIDLPATAGGAHSAPAANPTPSSALNHSLNHPPYAEMITAAIGALKERNGSSRVAIAKYIESTYTNLPPSHSALLTHHLKRLKSNGVLQMVKHSYKLKLPRSEPAANGTSAGDSVPGIKRGRGRPPKHRPVPNPNADPSLVFPDPNPSPNPTLVALGLVDDPTVVAPVPASPKRGPGRPPKAEASPGAAGSAEGPRRRSGRPPKYRPTAAPVAGLGSAGVKRSRGRPRKVGSSSATLVPGNLAVPALSVKRRGRPPRVGGARKPRKLTGRPVGRPRKNVVLTGMLYPPQRPNPNDLKITLEHFQLKIKQAVGVLKTQLTTDSDISMAAALQDLEQLAGMDLNAPFAAQGQPPVQQGQEQVPQVQEQVLYPQEPLL